MPGCSEDSACDYHEATERQKWKRISQASRDFGCRERTIGDARVDLAKQERAAPGCNKPANEYYEASEGEVIRFHGGSLVWRRLVSALQSRCRSLNKNEPSHRKKSLGP